MSQKLKTWLGAAFIIGVVTIILYLATDWINWNFYGWFSWLMIIIGKILLGIED